jgi:hypothetical protein
MAELTVPQVNFAPLGQLGKIYKESVNEQGLKDAFSQGVGNDPQSLAALAQKVAPYNPQMGINLAQLAHTIGRQGTQDARQQGLDTFNQKMERERLELARQAAARAADKTPANWVEDPNSPGGYKPIGPADPAYQAQLAAAKAKAAEAETANQFFSGIDRRKKAAADLGLAEGTPEFQQYVATETFSRPKPRDLPTSVVKDMNEKGGLLEDFTRIDNGFKDEYGGFKTAFAGDAVNTIARNTGIGNEERATWWQDYQNQKNIVRNKLFGSALTATEKTEFDKANIHPGMTPGTIRENLRLQRDAQRRAAVKLVNTYSKMGYSQEQIEAATGFPLSEIQAPAARPAPAGAPKSGGVVSFTDYFRQ